LKSTKSTAKDDRTLTAALSKGSTPPIPTSPKPSSGGVNWRRSVALNTSEQEPTSTNNNAFIAARIKKKEISMDDEGDLIEHDLLNLVEQEQQKDLQRNTPPAIPAKKRIAPTVQENNLDVEPTTKLIHPGNRNFFMMIV
jgi:hypothetical protein